MPTVSPEAISSAAASAGMTFARRTALAIRELEPTSDL
jgi:hypothetical protein